MYFKHTPSIIKPLAKDLVFDLPNDRSAIYVTFDDGPHPEITPQVLSLLDRFHAKATFFLIGERAQRFPELVDDMLRRGHSIGNHTQHHLSGWKTSNDAYALEVNTCAEHVQGSLFRPPYGELTLAQSQRIKKTHRIILWSDLSADFDAKYSAEDCFRFATEKVKAGSIIVFHDSEKAQPRMLQALEKSLSFYENNGFKMEAIPMG